MTTEENKTPEAEEPKKPTLELAPKQVLCPLHGEPFTAKWPAGFPRFALMALERFHDLPTSPALVKAAGGDHDYIAAMKVILGRRPLCCQLPAVTLYNALLEAGLAGGVWTTETCTTCGLKAPGAACRTYNAATEKGSTGSHICLACICGVRLVAAPKVLPKRRTHRRMPL